MNELFRLPEREWFQQHRVHYAENRRVRSNTQCECEEDGRGEPGTRAKTAQTDAHILSERRNAVSPSGFPRRSSIDIGKLVVRPGDVSKLATRLGVRVVARVSL